jgi:hypothetical protein
MEPKKVSSFNNDYPNRIKWPFDALPIQEGYKDSFSLSCNYRQSLIGKIDFINNVSYYSNDNTSYGITNKAPHINM